MSAQFSSLEELCSKLQGTRPIKKLLVANNGLAALKGIRSIRDWLYDHLSDSDAIQFAVMATPEDMEVNAEFIRMSDQHVEVPGGSNANNYANVDLIVSTAIQLGCDAVYPGWGHASENPALPRECEKSRKVTFLGPPEGPMFALGDKIASTIIAQSNGVPTVPWSGDHLKLPEGTFHIDPAVYDQAYVTTAEQCVEVCKRIGFPVMIKASEGGGGKGIRRTTSIDQVADMFHAVKEEVKGCHIFVMRMLSNVRHLEVQLLADKHGNCIAVRTRDCSVQRRHQKIIEEGPVVGVDPATVLEMENAAIRLAHAVGYVGLGTVEYMYDKETGKFSFLELNPRIQVEHPVSELISGVNLPAALLCVGMGIPLYRIPEIRAFYGEHLYGDSVIDFKTRMAQPPRCHAIAVRVTAEDVDEGFRPTTGHIDEISFRNSRDCWGYFSVSSGGGVHQFADSQFGHIFSTGETREDARRGMVIALRNITVRGEIRTSSAYVRELLEMQEFRECDVSTSWLDGLIANRSRAIKEQDMWPALIAAAITRMKRHEENNAEKYAQFLRAGHVPSIDYLSDVLTETFVLHTNKYVLEIGKINPSEYAISLNGSVAIVPCREFSSGALQMTLGGRTVVAYGEEEPASLRITINGKSTSFTGDVDPTKLRSSVPGRLVRFVVPDGGHVDENCAYAEVEVMKMILQLKSAVSGTVHLRATAGCTVTIGKLLAEVDPDDPSKVTRPTEVTDTWPDYIANPPQPTTSGIARVDGVTRARAALDSLWNMVLGYSFEQCSVQERINDAIDGLPSLCLSSVSIRSLNRAFFEPADFDASTPNDKMHAVYRCIINKYLETERWFDGCTREEAIDKLRERFGEDTATVRAIDFAHHKQHRHEVVRRLLVELEQNRTLMTSCKDILKELSELQSSHYYGAVLLQARYLQRQTSMPSFDQRKAQLAAKLEEGQIESIINMSFGFDLMCAVMFDPRSPHLAQLSLELFVRRSYFGVATLTSVDIFKKAGTWTGMWRFDTAELDDALTVTEDASVAAAAAPRSPFGGDLPANGWGFAALYFDEQEMTQNFGNLLSMVTTEAEAESVATIFVSLRADLQQNELARRCHEVLHANLKALTTSLLQTVTFIVHGAPNGPSIFTFTRRRDFAEDSIQRNLIPTTASRLELHMLSKYSLEMFSTPHRSVHIFTAVPRDVGRAVLPMEHRMFVRMYVSPGDLGVEPWTVLTELECSRVLSTFIAATEFARADKKLAVMVYNHLFINLIELTMNVAEVGATMRKLASSYAKKLFSLGFREVELKFRAVTPEGTVPFRVFITNHTGYSLQISSFVEAYEAGKIYLQPAQTTDDIADEEQLLASPSVAKSGIGCRHFSVDQSMDELASAADTPDSSHLRSPNAKPALRRNMSIKKLQSLKKLLPSRDSQSESPAAAGGAAAGGSSLFTGAIALEPYPATSARQLKRLQAQAIPTTYVHDWAIVFEVALRGQWKELAAGRGLPQSAIPSRPVEFVQLTLNDAQTALEEGEPTGRKISGMLVWRCDYFPPTYFDLARGEPESRSVIIVANDITFQSGSFSVAEDVVFKAACDMAQEKGLPFVYLSANSGARLGLSAEVKKYFKAALRADTFDYIYLTPEDLSTLSSKGVVVNTEKVVVEGTGEVRHKIIDIIGENGDYLGVENLQGSALIAGLMSQNYATIPTISVATGRTVGIGAYLVRLGRRVVQCKNAPIILTGASALNRLLGKEVYTGNNQLGGNAIMQPNGVTHWEAKDDLAAVQQVLNWLNFVPAVTDMRKCVPRVLTLPQVDPIDRDVTFFPARDELYDPRQLVAGNGTLTGMFDKGSFNESLKDWAKTVAVGRATLGGIPCGVILVETRITKKFDPADPADPQSTSSFVSQAGQVWFPDSARKTADALEDFHHERLPCFIFANWRGFSGGMRDMFDEVIKFGASIVDNLRVYTAPVFIYIPPFGELRGGAWVVVDPVINHQGVVEMYCDKTARGGILEPAGVVEIKFREAELRQVMLRNHPELAELHKTDPHEARKREAQLLPLYNDIAIHFADLHDTPGRMKAKGCIVDVIPWAESRRRFHVKLQRKLREVQLAGTIVESGVAPALDGALRMLKQWCLEAHRGDATVWGDDAQALQWMHEQVGTIKKRVASFHNAVVAERLAKEFEAASGEGAAQLLASKLVSALSPALREALKREIDEKNREENL